MSALVNYILLESKYIIFRCNLNNDSLCIRLLVDKLKKKTLETEHLILKKEATTTKSISTTKNGSLSLPLTL